MTTLGLALGGGAARGLAHLGVLDVFARAGIRPDLVVGTSFGALVGAAVLARGGDVEAVLSDVAAYAGGDLFRRSALHLFRQRRELDRAGTSHALRDVISRGPAYGLAPPPVSLLPPEDLAAAIDAVVPDVDVESLPVRFAAVAADLESGREVLLDSGALRLAVRASCAIPGLTPPVAAAGGLLIDGGWVEKVPAEAARLLGADVVVAVDVSDDLADTRGLAPALRGDGIRSNRLKELQLARADVVVRVPVADVHWADFHRVSEIVDLGRRAAEQALPSVRSVLEGLAHRA